MEYDETYNERRNHTFRVVITEIDEVGNELELHNEVHRSVCMLGEDVENENRMCEIMVNENITGLASMIANSQKHRLAARLAMDVIDAERKKNFDMEDLLMDLMQGSEGRIQ